ncbi:MAG: hypothetical protein R6V28_14570 [Nitriliruptoraceae bacterium]
MEYAGQVDGQALAAFDQRVAERLVASGHPAYGLGDAWTGPRTLGDVHLVGDDIDSAGLAHGDVTNDHGPLIQIHTTRVRSNDLDRVFASRSELVVGAYDGQPVPAFVSQDVQLQVDGETRDCAGFVVDEGWLGRVDPGTGVTIYVEARRVELAHFASEQVIVAIDDLTPYIEGRRAFLDGLSGG